MTMTIRCLPPGNGKKPGLTVNGRSYTCALNGFLDLPEFDAQVASGNGWLMVNGYSGPTSLRPATASTGTLYLDTTLNLIVIHDGTVWRNPVTGAAA